jgi:hypothetical protein
VELDLSENLIGSAENLNTVMPDLVTGGTYYFCGKMKFVHMCVCVCGCGCGCVRVCPFFNCNVSCTSMAECIYIYIVLGWCSVGEALAELLRSDGCVLQCLKLGTF